MAAFAIVTKEFTTVNLMVMDSHDKPEFVGNLYGYFSQTSTTFFFITLPTDQPLLSCSIQVWVVFLSLRFGSTFIISRNFRIRSQKDF